ncbi:hypothetical protein HU200_029324 [Digitaria exilis]|uniref:Uncharacterized protein n=1 Tax=Digitaria exilis TaxID=1010633 RepID=A0A835BR34_9POAL|nr:hypothetical protein HU200_029324 [Digitaria exilis]
MHLDSYSSVLCIENVDEDIMHHFFTPFSSACWTYLDIHWNTSVDFQTMMLEARVNFGSVIFREVIIMAMWSIWTHRNSIIFDGGSLSFAWWRRSFVEGMMTVTLRINSHIKDKIVVWLSSL